jgi:hypothetical protein
MVSSWVGAVSGGTGWGYTQLLTDSMIDLAAGKGASSIRIMLDKYNWNNADQVYKNYIVARIQHCHVKGLKVLVDLTYDLGTSDGNNQYLYNYKVIADSALAAAWISWGKDVIASCKPDAIGVMNEPREGGGVTWNDYYAFAVQSITAYKAAAASVGVLDFKVFVQGYPFSSTFKFAGTPITLDTAVVFESHLYYNPFITSGHVAYLNACADFYAGRIVDGTGWLHNYMDYKIAGLPLDRVNFGEIGVFNDASHPWNTDPSAYFHWQDWMKAVYENVVVKGMLGYHQYSLSGWSMYVMVDASTVQFTPYGQFWADYLVGGGDVVANIVFTGSLKETVSGVVVPNSIGEVRVTKPNGTVELIQVITDVAGNYSTTKQYSDVGTYSATAFFSADSKYKESVSPVKVFSVSAVLLDRVVTLNVAVA